MSMLNVEFGWFGEFILRLQQQSLLNRSHMAVFAVVHEVRMSTSRNMKTGNSSQPRARTAPPPPMTAGPMH